MESTFVLVLIFAGVAVALLGAVLIASERELKTKRREIDGLLARLESMPRSSQTAAAGQLETDGSAAADLRARNRELENQLSALSGELAQSRQTVDALQAAQRDHSGEQEETRRLMSANDQLARELEAARQNLPNLSAIEAERGQERQAFQEQISNLEKRLAMEQQNLSEMQTLRDRLAEADNVQRSLRAEIIRHEDEIPRWQARIAAAEESAQRLAALQAPCNELLSRHAELTDRQRRLQEELAAFARQITAPADGFQPSGSTFAEPAKGVEPV
jgi:chromosome segregation ATPase